MEIRINKIGILLDCDGTLANSLNLGMGSFDYAFEKLGERFYRPEEITKFFGAGADRIFFQILGDQKKAERAFDFYFEHESKQITKIHLHDGIQEFLDLAKNANVPMGVVTGRHSRDLELIIKHHGISKYFEVLVCDDHLTKSKPSPEGILLAASKLGIKPNDLYYIGDSIMDLQAANAAGAKGIAALWDQWVRPEEMAKQNPSFMARTPLEIWHYLTHQILDQ